MQDKGRKYVKPGEREDIDGEIADLRKNPKSRKIFTTGKFIILNITLILLDTEI